MNRKIEIGDVVKVGPRYVMSDKAPHAGNGRVEADEWTGKTMQVVGFDRTDGAHLSEVDSTEDVVTIHTRRLTPVA